MRYKWKTKDGQVLFVDKMKDSHLLNAQRLVNERKNNISQNVSAAYSMSSFLSGDMALDQIERDIQMLEDLEIDINLILHVLDEEIAKRKLKALPIRTQEIISL